MVAYSYPILLKNVGWDLIVKSQRKFMHFMKDYEGKKTFKKPIWNKVHKWITDKQES